VISHGGGGTFVGHSDTARALAEAGFVVAAVNHAGDTFGDEGRVLELWRRPQQLERLITFMLTSWRGPVRVDPDRVGAFGFSNGGFTVLVAAGGAPDLKAIKPYCERNPQHDLCAALANAGIDPGRVADLPGEPWLHDRRIAAAAIAAPAFGFAFTRRGLADVKAPVQLWGGSLDTHQPPPGYEDQVRENLPAPPAFHRVEGAGHYDFLPPCDPSLARAAPHICASAGTFDRGRFHERFNAAIVRFFARRLKARPVSLSAPPP
jgi:predicted dienelactone hydrolase